MRYLPPSSSLLALGLLFASVVAKPQDGDRTTEQEEAQIKGALPPLDPNAECAGYYYAPVSNALSQFPAPAAQAHMVPGDTEAQDKFNSIKDLIPNIAPKGTPEGDFSSVASYPSDDPDCWWTRTQCVSPKLQGLPPDIFEVPEPLTNGYGFDDGPNCSHNAFYDFLQEQNQKATMFFVGTNVIYQPLEAQRALTDGHEICVHTWSHHYMTALSNEDAFAELWYSVTPTCWRPPFGDVDDRIRAIAAALNLQTILWKYDSFDWKVTSGQATPDQVNKNYDDFANTAKTGGFDTPWHGGIILSHEGDQFTMQAAIDNYPKLKDAFKYIVPVGVALNKTRPYVEANYSLPTFDKYISGTTVVLGETPQSDGATTSLALGAAAASGTSTAKSSQSSSAGDSNHQAGNSTGNSTGSSGKNDALSTIGSPASSQWLIMVVLTAFFAALHL
ncbi:hypothetical protein D9758_003595 [Tetrapyrgos nigripes]|uniref:chitin deacetylase n=1 Tax=Tetrapyrgos nigripes TaxID=182062 RepID=A0A8H5GUU4_9AGAR|nr:hypothetical protein D9758_003595 [Tetrapyrgos nigripes]